MTREAWKKAFGHLGPVAAGAWPDYQRHSWMAMGFDVQVAIEASYPKLSDEKPRTEGRCPDLDVDAFLTFAHREGYWAWCSNYVATAHRAIPGLNYYRLKPVGSKVS